MFQFLSNIRVSFVALLFISLRYFMVIDAFPAGSSALFFSSNGDTYPKTLTLISEKFQDDQVYDVADKMPRPAGGQDDWEEYLSENLRYPSAAKKSKIEGVVNVVFIVEKDGRTSNVKVLRGIGSGCDEEAKRLIEGSPKWTPGKNNGESVRVRMRLPIRFHLPN